MLSPLRLPAARRCYSQSLAAVSPKPVQHAYFVRRNTRGSIPVYTDTRMHTKFCTLIRNVEGNAQVGTFCFYATLRRRQ